MGRENRGKLESREELGAGIAGQGREKDEPMARTAICFNRGHCSSVSSVIGIRVVITTSASFILSTMVAVSEGVDGYSVYVCVKEGEKVGEWVWMPSRRTMCGGCEDFISG